MGIGVQKTTLDALGRWRAGSSSEYIRTSKRLVIDAQNAVAKAIKEYEGNDDVFGRRWSSTASPRTSRPRGLTRTASVRKWAACGLLRLPAFACSRPR